LELGRRKERVNYNDESLSDAQFIRKMEKEADNEEEELEKEKLKKKKEREKKKKAAKGSETGSMKASNVESLKVSRERTIATAERMPRG